MRVRLVSSSLARHATFIKAPRVVTGTKNARCLSTSTQKMSDLFVNALGVDRVGIVSGMTKLVTDVGGRVGESQATKLGSKYFSLTMIVTVPTDQVESLKKSLKDDASVNGLSTHYMESPDNEPEAVRPTGIGYSGRFELSGADHPGLVTAVTSKLASHGLNIDTMETTEEDAPYGGTTLFSIEGIVTAPKPLAKGFDTEQIRDELLKLGESLNCDVVLEDHVMRKSRLSTEIWENMA